MIAYKDETIALSSKIGASPSGIIEYVADLNSADPVSEYKKVKGEFDRLFTEIFTTAVIDEAIRDTLYSELSLSADRVRVILTKAELIDRIFLTAEDMKPQENLNMYSEELNFEGRSLYMIVKMIYQDIYD